MPSHEQTPYARIAMRIAEIADMHARILRADEYDMPDDLTQALNRTLDTATEDAVGQAIDEDAIREDMAKQYLQRELTELKSEAASYNITVAPELIEALIPQISDITHWMSSSYRC